MSKKILLLQWSASHLLRINGTCRLIIHLTSDICDYICRVQIYLGIYILLAAVSGWSLLPKLYRSGVTVPNDRVVLLVTWWVMPFLLRQHYICTQHGVRKVLKSPFCVRQIFYTKPAVAGWVIHMARCQSTYSNAKKSPNQNMKSILGQSLRNAGHLLLWKASKGAADAQHFCSCSGMIAHPAAVFRRQDLPLTRSWVCCSSVSVLLCWFWALHL